MSAGRRATTGAYVAQTIFATLLASVTFFVGIQRFPDLRSVTTWSYNPELWIPINHRSRFQ